MVQPSFVVAWLAPVGVSQKLRSSILKGINTLILSEKEENWQILNTNLVQETFLLNSIFIGTFRPNS